MEKRFCPDCALDFSGVVVQGAVAADAGGRANRETNVNSNGQIIEGNCPNGGHPDFVRLVRAVHKAGISATAMSGGTYYASSNDPSYVHHLSGTSQTELSALLAPPVQPVAGALTVARPKPSRGSVLLVRVILAVFLALFLGTLIQQSAAVLLVILAFFGFVLVYGLGESARIQTAQAAQAAALQPLWRAAMDRWSNAYYCSKCDGVFLAGSDMPLVPASQARSTLFALG
jgi:hypothetical protein